MEEYNDQTERNLVEEFRKLPEDKKEVYLQLLRKITEIEERALDKLLKKYQK